MGQNQSQNNNLPEAEEEHDEEREVTVTPEKQAPSGTAKLYQHTGGVQNGKWSLVNPSVTPRFLLEGGEDSDEDEDEKESEEAQGGERVWYLAVGKREVLAAVSNELNLQPNPQQKRVDFVADGVWALRFKEEADYKEFVAEYEAALFENNYGMELNAENQAKVFGTDYALAFGKGQDADEMMFDAEEEPSTPPPQGRLRETRTNSTPGRTAQMLTMGAMAKSYVLHSGGLDVFRNMREGIDSDDITIKYPTTPGFVTPKKAMLMRGETNMMLLSPQQGARQASSVHQLDIESGKVVAEWKFQKDGVDVGMRDITNDTKAAQLDASRATFMGLDDNRLVRWDMRDRHGIVQEIASPTLNWSEGHQFSRGTNFNCMATTGDGFVAVGSVDGKVRLYGTTSMRQAKTSFPGLGSPITSIDVTYDGRWILATTDSYLMLISTIYRDKKDGREKNAFQGRAGSQIAAPRLLKLNPVDAHAAGPGHKFRNGQFSWVTEADAQERNLVATVGQYSVVWNFRRVKQSNHECYLHQTGVKTCYCYKIVPKTESIVDSKFMHDSFLGAASPEAPLVVATPAQVSSFNV